MIHHIDVSSVLRRTVCELYSNLVTRPTGAAVRREIELSLEQLPEPSLTVIDFTHVGLLDFSCADEVVGKLLDHVINSPVKREAYFLVRGAHDSHLEAIETVLERYGIAVVVQDAAGGPHVLGAIGDRARVACDFVYRRGRISASELAPEVGEETDACTETLDKLWERRLVMRDDDGYVALHIVQ